MKINDEILEINNIDFSKLKIQEAIDFLLNCQTAKIKFKRSQAKRNKEAHDQNSIAKLINLNRPNCNTSFGFTINTTIEANLLNKLTVTRFVSFTSFLIFQLFKKLKFTKFLLVLSMTPLLL